MVLHGHQYTAGSEDGSSGCMTQVQRPTASFSLKEYHYSDIKWWKYSHSDVMGLGALGGCSCDQEGCLSWLLVCISQGLLPPVHIQFPMPKKRSTSTTGQAPRTWLGVLYTTFELCRSWTSLLHRQQHRHKGSGAGSRRSSCFRGHCCNKGFLQFKAAGWAMTKLAAVPKHVRASVRKRVCVWLIIFIYLVEVDVKKHHSFYYDIFLGENVVTNESGYSNKIV